MSFPNSRTLRRLVLAGAVAAALVAGGSLSVPTVAAEAAADRTGKAAAAPTTPAAARNPASNPADATPPDATPPDVTPPDAAPAKKAASKGLRIGISVDSDKADADQPAADKDEIVIEKGSKGKKRVHVRGAGRNRDYDSFDDFMTDEPTAGMVVAIVGIIFLSPALIVGLVIWYRMRKARMLNETVLKLAERGAVPPAEAMQALTMGQLPPAAVIGSATAAPLGNSPFAAMTEVRRAAIKSDLRKAIILAALGIAFTMHSTYDGGAPNIFGLILLFLGIGYGVLWWFESRQIDAVAGGQTPPGGPGTVGPTSAP